MGDVLARVSPGGTGLPALRVHVPTAIPVPAESAALAVAAASAVPAGGGTIDYCLYRDGGSRSRLTAPEQLHSKRES